MKHQDIKIVMLCDFYNPTLLYQENLLAKYYIKHGVKVSIITSTIESIFDYTTHQYNKNLKQSETVIDGVKIIRLPFSINILNKLRKFEKITEVLKAEKPDIIFSHDFQLNLLDAVKYKQKYPACKIIMDYHADYSNSASSWISLYILHKIIRKSFFRYCLKYIDKIYPIVPAGFTFLHEVYGVTYERMELLPLGTDMDFAQTVKNSGIREKIREQFDIQARDLVIFTGGKLTPQKKTDLLIEAVLSLQNPNLHLIIVGDFQEQDYAFKQKLEDICRENQKIHFTGWLNSQEVYDYMSASDLAVFPASQSVLWQQSMSMGLPLIVGKVGVQDSSYLNINNSLIILEENQINIHNLAQNIKMFADKPMLLQTMKKAALKTAEEFLNYDRIVQKTLEFNT